MTDIIERVAMAIKDCGAYSPDWQGGDEDLTIMARAAIAAMRDPTIKMIVARLESQLHPTGFAPRVQWQAMIDAALEEPK